MSFRMTSCEVGSVQDTFSHLCPSEALCAKEYRYLQMLCMTCLCCFKNSKWNTAFKKKKHLRENNLNCSIELSMWYSRFLNLNKVSICSVVQESQGKLLESRRRAESKHAHIEARFCFLCGTLLKQTQVCTVLGLSLTHRVPQPQSSSWGWLYLGTPQCHGVPLRPARHILLLTQGFHVCWQLPEDSGKDFSFKSVFSAVCEVQLNPELLPANTVSSGVRELGSSGTRMDGSATGMKVLTPLLLLLPH